MCGLVGIAGFISNFQDAAFRDMLVVDSIRGRHSTGVLSLGTGKRSKPKVSKAVGSGAEMLDNKLFNRHISAWNSLLLGHNRYATKGAINSDNAHPFQKGKIVGAHNGTLTRQDLLVDSGDFQVDSENIFHSIDKIGLEDTYEVLTGAWALSWYDCKTKKVNFIRNNKRPLSFCFSEDRLTLYWASEEGMLEFILKRNNLRHSPIERVDTHTLYEISPRNIKAGFKKTPLTPPKWEQPTPSFGFNKSIPWVGQRMRIVDVVVEREKGAENWHFDGWSEEYQMWCTAPLEACEVVMVKALGDVVYGTFSEIGNYVNEAVIDVASLQTGGKL